MKKIIIKLAITFLASSLFSQDSVATYTEPVPQTTDLTVEISGLESDEGQVLVALYDSKDTWLKKNIKGAVSKIVDGKATIVFEGVPLGIYAVSTFHDKDSDNKLKTGFMGIPKEPYASSRGAKGMFGPPKWSDALFSLEAPTATEVITY